MYMYINNLRQIPVNINFNHLTFSVKCKQAKLHKTASMQFTPVQFSLCTVQPRVVPLQCSVLWLDAYRKCRLWRLESAGSAVAQVSIPSMCPSICLSQAGIASKLLKLSFNTHKLLDQRILKFLSCTICQPKQGAPNIRQARKLAMFDH